MLKKTQSKFPKVLQGWLGHRKIEEIECVISDMAGVVRGKAMPLSKFEKLENVYIGQIKIILFSSAYFWAPAFVTKFSSVQVNPESQYIAGIFSFPEVDGMYIEKCI